MAESGSSKRKGSHAEPAPETSPAAAPETETVSVSAFSTGWYWITLVVAVVSLVIAWLYYSARLEIWVKFAYWTALIISVGLLAWSFLGLLRRYNVARRLGASAQRLRGGEAGPEEEVVYRENIVVRAAKYVWRLVMLLLLFVWNTFLRILFIVEMTILQLLLLLYDIFYYVLYAAWTIVFYAVRLALRIVLFALRVAWKILRILTKLPGAKQLWTRKMRPAIMGKYNHQVAHLKQQRAVRLDQKRRLVAARGGDPDQWQRDRELRHHFPLHHPHDARKGLRARIEWRQKQDYNRRDRWAAYRKGLPIPPKLHRERPPGTEKQPGPKREKRRRRGKEPLPLPEDLLPDSPPIAAADEK